jgi:hypothetical protein
VPRGFQVQGIAGSEARAEEGATRNDKNLKKQYTRLKPSRKQEEGRKKRDTKRVKMKANQTQTRNETKAT